MVVQNEGVSVAKALRIVFKSVPNTAQEMRVWAVCSLLVQHCPRESKIPGAPRVARLKVGEWREGVRRELAQAVLYERPWLVEKDFSSQSMNPAVDGMFLVIPGLMSCTLFITVNGLYSSSDDVIELTPSNFNREVIQSDSLWLVEFYAPW